MEIRTSFFKLFIIFTCLNLLVTQKSFANEAPVFSPQDVFAFTRIGTVAPSPDGKQVAFITMRLLDGDANKIWRYGLFLKDEKGQTVQLVESTDPLSMPTWSPDGKKITYLAKGDKHLSIWTVGPVYRKPEKTYEFSSDIHSYKWSPNGNYIVFVAHKPDKADNKVTQTANWDGESLQLFLINLDNYAPPKAMPLTGKNMSITLADVPHNDTASFDWAPDSQSIVFAYQPKAGSQYLQQSKIAKLNLNNPIIETIAYTEQHPAYQPKLSPDGKLLAFTVINHNPNNLATSSTISNEVCLLNIASSSIQCLKTTPNQNPIILGWNTNSDAIYVIDRYNTEGMRIYSLDVNGLWPAKLISDVPGYIDPTTLSLNQNHSVLGFAYETNTDAPQVYVSPADHFQLQKISNLSAPNPKSWGKLKNFEWKSPDGITIEGILHPPLNYKSEQSPLFGYGEIYRLLSYLGWSVT